MTNKSTNFKRVALAVVAALGVGLLSAGPSAQATPIAASLTIDSASTKASTVTAGDTATASMKTTFTTESTYDSVVVRTTCLTPSGAACGQNGPGTQSFDIDFYWTATPDSATGTSVSDGSKVTSLGAGASAFTQNSGDSIVVSNSGTGAATSFTWNAKARTTTSTTAGTYAITFYLQGSNNGAAATAANANSQTVTWNVTVSALSTTVASIVTYVGSTAASGTISAASAQALYYRDNAVYTGAKESSIVFATTAADAQSPRAAGVVYGFAANSAGETFTATGTVNICSSGCAVTAVIEGPGLLTKDTLNAGTPTKSVTVTYYNGASGQSNKGDTLTVYSDGTAGTSTLKFYSGITLLKSVSLVFTGAPASATSVSLTDTYVANTTTTLRAVIKDAGGNALTAGTVYVYASDTWVVSSGATSTNAAQFTQLAAGVKKTVTDGTSTGQCAGYDATLGRFSCSITVRDSGTATLVFRDSWTVAASTWASDPVIVYGRGLAASYAISFDKATYTPGELAVITIKGTDLAGNPATGGASMSLVYSLGLGNGGSTVKAGSKAAASLATNTYGPNKVIGSGAYYDSETFVVYMPMTTGTLTVTGSSVPASTSATQGTVNYTASAVVSDPVQTAQNTAIANAQAAADAATDAALQAIDAANAATDAANLAAEAADAATVAAQESKDAADAATAAVESLATQVATLMAALQAQITSLANVVAKIAKKVKA